jgi:Na+-translocating ferredoxin:NAD+ oxidoreductase RnfG subunit
MRRCSALVLILAFAGPVLQAQSVAPAKVRASIARVFGAGASAETLATARGPVLRAARHDSLLGYATVRDVRGKDQPITFLLAVNEAGEVLDVDILVYREPYGGEVAYESWRRQFRGRTARDSVRVGRPIRNISGATISSNAVTQGVRRALDDLTALRREGALR